MSDMASQTTWKPSQASLAASRSPSPPPRSRVDWLPETEVSQAAARYYQRLHAQKKRRYDALAGRRETGHGRHNGHSRAMDALASTALASSSSSSGAGNSTAAPQHRNSASAIDSERPTKRIRSENHHGSWPTPLHEPGRRPTTSYEQSTASNLEDAELLLNFMTNAHTSTNRVTAAGNHFRSASFGAKPSFVSPSTPTSANMTTSPTQQHPSSGSLPQYQSIYERPKSGHFHAPSNHVYSNSPYSSNKAPAADSTSTQRPSSSSSKKSASDGSSKIAATRKTKSTDVPEAPPSSSSNPNATEAGKSNEQDVDVLPEATSKVGEGAGREKEEAHTDMQIPSTTRDTDVEMSENAAEAQADVAVESQGSMDAEKTSEGKGAKPAEASDQPRLEQVDNKPVIPDGSVPANVQNDANDAPQVCAACNFHRNNLTLETENEATSWISCDGCNKWFHFACAGFKTQREVRSVDKFRCKMCKSVHGPTTYVRKSARAHAPIDYAELNQGVVKTSEESPEHHYIKPIKEGSIKFTPESFARIRPELVTADFWLRGDGMREPVVIPAIWNPRPRRIPRPEDAPDDTNDDPADDGLLHDQSALDSEIIDQLECDQVPDEGQDLLDMVIPHDLTVRRVSELYGPEEKIEVIDVKSQNGEDKRWNMRKWTEYYESSAPNKPVRNVISLEVSQSPLGRLIRRPKVVRDLDLQDSVWPTELASKGDFPKVQFYCLMSVADCYTDFHIDFGGSSVYYHILKGKKTFFFIPPSDSNLKKYEDWCNSDAQNYTFLGDQTKVCYRVDLGPGDTMLIPAGWIHAVWTPEDSLVIGGNFLTRQNYAMQIRVTQIEKATKVPKKFRYPHFQKIMWYTMVRYLATDPIPESVVETLLSGKTFDRKKPIWDDYEQSKEEDGKADEEDAEEPQPGSEQYNHRSYAKCELDGLPELARYLQRTAYIVAGYVTDGVSSDTKRAVQRSIPKEYKHHGPEPIDCVRKFAMWCAWKRGNEYLPHWAYPDHVPEVNAPEVTQKKLSAAHIRRLEREAAMSAQRVSDRPQREKKPPSNLYNEMIAEQEKVKAMKTTSSPSSVGAVKQEMPNGDSTPIEAASPSIKNDGQPRKRKSASSVSNRQPACEACRKGRRACKHRDSVSNDSSAGHPLTDNEASMDTDAIADISVKMEMDTAESALPENSSLEEDAPPTTPHTKSSLSATARPKVSTTSPSKDSATQGRTKACADCRKSKRRCVHDEFGRQDPIKMAQASQPRPAAKKKRPSDAGDTKEKKPKRPSTSNGSLAESSTNLDATSPILVASATSVVQPATQQPTPVMPSETLSQTDESIIVPSTTEEGRVNEESEENNDAKDSPSALVSPPESSHTDHERTASPAHSLKPATDEGGKGRDLSPPTTASEPRSRRTSQLPANKVSVIVPTSPKQVRSRAMSTVSVDSAKTGRTGQVSIAEGTDEDTMKLIHEMMAEDRGLRARREPRAV